MATEYSYPYETHFALLNGCRIFYATAGNSEHTPLIVLHGGRGTGDHRDPFRAFLPLSSQLYLIGIDMRGHGRSEETAPLTFKQLAADIEALRTTILGGRKIILLGGSFGGMIAQQYAVTYPDALEALILRGTAPSHDHEGPAMENLKAKLDKATNASVEMLDKLFNGKMSSNEEVRLISFALAPMYVSGDFDANKALQSQLDTIIHYKTHTALYTPPEKLFDYTQQLSVLGEERIPVLLIVGELDWICPKEQSMLIKECIDRGVPSGEESKVRLEIVPGANHGVHNEKNTEVISLIEDFLRLG